MKEKNITKKAVLKSATKMLSDKELVISYIKGKASLKTLEKKGIKFAKPL
jgi:hypothetical protein